MADLYNISTARSEEIASSYLRHSRPRPLRSMSPRELSAADHTRLSNSLEAFHGNLSLQRTLGIYLRESRRVSRKIELDGLLSNLRNVIEQYELDANQVGEESCSLPSTLSLIYWSLQVEPSSRSYTRGGLRRRRKYSQVDTTHTTYCVGRRSGHLTCPLVQDILYAMGRSRQMPKMWRKY